MASHGSASHRQIFSEINITPLTDIFLVLLIIMMVVAPMMRQLRGDIQPPEVTAGAPADQDKLTVEVLANGDVFVDGEPTALTDLTEVLARRHEAMVAEEAAKPTTEEGENADGLALPGTTTDAKAPVGMVIVRADKTARTESVLKVFDAARDAGYAKLTIAGTAASDAKMGPGNNASSALPSEASAGLDPVSPSSEPDSGQGGLRFGQ